MPSELGTSDTSDAILSVRDAMLREMSMPERVQRIRELCRAVEWLAREGLSRRRPDLDAAGQFREMAEQRLGPALAAAVYGPLHGAD